MKNFLLFLFLGLSTVLRGNDSLQVLSENEFVQIVRSFHPMAKQAKLLVDRARADLLASRAGFDPQFYVYSDRKTLDGKIYYDYTHPQLKIPTWFGIDIKAGLEENLGTFRNPEVTEGRSSYLGLSVPLVKNLVMDKRRAMLKQAKLFREQSKAEQLLMVNDLLMEAYDAYWQWVRTYETFRVLQDAVQVSQTRFSFIKLGYRQGDRPALDTTEALAQLQSFELAREQARMEWRNATLWLSNYLWTENELPVTLPENVQPDRAWTKKTGAAAGLPVLQEVLTQARTDHPKLTILGFKMDILEVERRLKFQSLLPTVNVDYNLLNKGYAVWNNPNAVFFQNNYKYGLSVGLPLRLSEGRGAYKAAKIKIRETDLDRMQVRLAIDNKIRQYFNELVQYQSQIRIAEEALANYQRLFRGEELRFQIGESSLFLLNSRENKVLEARQKLLELQTKFYKSYRAIGWAAGQLR